MNLATILEGTRACVRDMHRRHAAVKDVLEEAEEYGWERLVASMSDENRVKLITMLAESTQVTHVVLGRVVGIYENVISTLVSMAEEDLDEMAVQMDEEIERAYASARPQERKETNWLELLTAGGIGYLLGKGGDRS